jgi:hypothetical protein
MATGPRTINGSGRPAALPRLKTKAGGVFGGNAADVPTGSAVQRRAMDAYHRTPIVFAGVVDRADDGAVEPV